MDDIVAMLKSLPNHNSCGSGYLIDPGVERQYPWYAKIFKVVDPHSILEVGTFLGYSLAVAAYSLPNLQSINFVDNETYSIGSNQLAIENILCSRKMAKFEKLRELEAFPCYEYFDHGFDLIHVDGDHTYNGVYRDMEYANHFKYSIMIGHDYTLIKDVENAVKDFCNKNKLTHIVLPEFNHGLWAIIHENESFDLVARLSGAGLGLINIIPPSKK